MSVPNFIVKNQYIGNNTLDTYTFDFKITDLSQLIVMVVNTDYSTAFRVRGTDTTYLDSVSFEEGGGGEVVLKDVLGTGQILTILSANDAPVQLAEFKNKADFTLKRFEDALDYAMDAIQRIAYLAQRSWKIGDVLPDDEPFDTTLPIVSTDTSVQDNRNRVVVIGDDNASLALGPTAIDLANESAIAAAAAAAASASASQAAISQSAALASAGNAATSEANAQAADADAINQAAAAAASAASIVGDVALANAAAALATTQATNAASSAMAAASSAMAAQSSALGAAASAINAGNYASAALVSQTAAAASAATAAAQAVIATAQAVIATNAAKPIPEYQMSMANDQDTLADVTDGTNYMQGDASIDVYRRFAYTVYRTDGVNELRESGYVSIEWMPMAAAWRIADRRGSDDALGTPGTAGFAPNLDVKTVGTIGTIQYLSTLVIGQTVFKFRWKFEQKMGVET